MDVIADQLFPVNSGFTKSWIKKKKKNRGVKGLARLHSANKLLIHIEKLPTSDTLQVLSTAGDGDEKALY